jgi:hypothetical protein
MQIKIKDLLLGNGLRSSPLVFLLTVIMFMSCSGNKAGKSESESKLTEQAGKTFSEIKLETFGYLEEVMGCSCYLATDSLQFKQQNFIYAEKYGLPDKKDFGFIKLDNQLIRLEVLSVENNSEESMRNVRLGNELVEVWLNLQLNQSGDPEVLPAKGEIQIHFPDRLPCIQTVVGTCGC